MSEISANNKSFGELISVMLATVRSYWTQAENYQKFAYSIAALLVASGIFRTGVFLVDGGSWQGAVSWRKAITFGFSFGITTFSLAWVMNFLPKHRLFNWILMGALGFATFNEVALVTLQRWRGTASHFNFATPFDSTVFNLMGVLIGIVGIVVLVITLLSFTSLKTSTSMAWAIRVGLLLLVISQAWGGLIINNGIQKAFDPDTQEFVMASVESAAILGAAGQMKLPHAATLHAIQVLPLLAWLLFFTNYDESRRTRITIIASAGYIGLAFVIAMQALSGLAPVDLSVLRIGVFALSMTLIATAFASTLIALRQTISRNS